MTLISFTHEIQFQSLKQECRLKRKSYVAFHHIYDFFLFLIRQDYVSTKTIDIPELRNIAQHILWDITKVGKIRDMPEGGKTYPASAHFEYVLLRNGEIFLYFKMNIAF